MTSITAPSSLTEPLTYAAQQRKECVTQTGHRKVVASYIVELEPGVYLSDTECDPGRTLSREHATRFPTERSAQTAINSGRWVLPSSGARVVESVDE